MIRTSIDIGSNSCLLLVLDVQTDGSFKTLESQARITSLGKDLDKNKLFLESSMDSTFEALSEYSSIISKYTVKPWDVLITATEASRVAKNADNFFTKVKEELGLSVTKISGEGEAYYTALGVSKGVQTKSNSLIIMDIGGASTELIKIGLEDFSIEKSISLPIGSVRATDWMQDGVFESELDKIFSKNDLTIYESELLVCVAGTMTTISAILLKQEVFNEEQIHDHEFSYNELGRLLETMRTMNSNEILNEYPICGKRATSIFGGGVVAKEIVKKLKAQKIKISTYGLRYGVALEGRIDERFTQER